MGTTQCRTACLGVDPDGNDRGRAIRPLHRIRPSHIGYDEGKLIAFRLRNFGSHERRLGFVHIAQNHAVSENLSPFKVQWIAVRIGASHSIEQHEVTRSDPKVCGHFGDRRAIRFSIDSSHDFHRSALSAVFHCYVRLAGSSDQKHPRLIDRNDPLVRGIETTSHTGTDERTRDAVAELPA